MFYLLVFGILGIFLTSCFLIFKNKEERKYKIFIKALTIIFLVFGFLRFFLSDYMINLVNTDDASYDIDFFQIILRWGYYLNYAVIPMAIFFRHRVFKNILCYFCLIFTILSVIFYKDFMFYFLDERGSGIHLAPWMRYVFFGLELGLAMFIPIFMQIKEKYHINYRDYKEWLNMLICIPLILMQMMPVYIPQYLFGYTSISPKAYSSYHLIWTGIMIVEFYILYKYFNYKCYEDRYMICVFLAIVLFFHYDSLYLKGITLPRLPVQLCNMAAYFYIICIPLRLKKMFNFCFICNIVGAVIATVTPDFSGGAFGFWNMHYMYEHMLVLIIPALAMGLRVFPRVNKKSLVHMVFGFTCYFMFCLILGTILNGFSDKTGTTVNYFFLFDMEKMYGWLPFLEFTEDLAVIFGRFEIYPLFVMIIYCGFLFLCVLFYWFVIKLYDYIDDHHELRKSSIDLYEKLTGKKSKRPVDYVE